MSKNLKDKLLCSFCLTKLRNWYEEAVYYLHEEGKLICQSHYESKYIDKSKVVTVKECNGSRALSLYNQELTDLKKRMIPFIVQEEI